MKNPRKRVRSSARIEKTERIHLDISEGNHIGLIILARDHGLTINQAINFLCNWAVVEGVLTPSRPDRDGEAWKDGTS